MLHILIGYWPALLSLEVAKGSHNCAITPRPEPESYNTHSPMISGVD
ncbi:hypothetical protein [Coxiella-like endosymbiont]|nr:hypothetical protein [Coxiella-like endosymbiont]